MDPSRNCIMGSWLWLAPIPWSLYPRYGLQGLDQQTRETTNGALNQNLPGKLGQQSAIYWNSLGLFRDYGLNFFFYLLSD